MIATSSLFEQPVLNLNIQQLKRYVWWEIKGVVVFFFYFQFILQIEMSRTGLTKIVTLTPKYVIINNTEVQNINCLFICAEFEMSFQGVSKEFHRVNFHCSQQTILNFLFICQVM